MIAFLLFVLSLAGSLLIQVPHIDAAPCFQAINGENLWRLTSQLGNCLNVCCSTLEVQNEELSSNLDECCEDVLSAIESVSSKVDIINSNLEVLSASSLDQIQSDLACIASNVEFICSESECLITTFSLLESLSEKIVENLSDVDHIFEQTVSAIDVSTSVLSNLIESTSEIVISSIDTLLISEVEACCNRLVSEIDAGTDETISVVDQCCSSILSILDTTSSGVDICCDVILSALESVSDRIVDQTESAIDASVSAICECVDSAQEIISDQINAITGSTLDGIESKLDILNSGIDVLCSDLDCVLEKFSLLDSLSDQALNNISDFDAILTQTVSGIDSVIDILENPICGITALCSNIDALGTSLTACCNSINNNINTCCSSINNNINTCCSSINNNIDNCCEDLRTRIDGLFGIIGTGFLDVLSAIAEVSGLVTDVLDVVNPTEEMVKDIQTRVEDIQTKVDSLVSSNDTVISGVDTLSNCLVGTPITTAPFVITMPGKYFLCKNLSLVGGTAITISGTQFVELDLNGHDIRANTGIDITSSKFSIYIHNGHITADTVGITTTNSDNITIEDVRVLDAPAFVFDTCKYITLTNCTAVYDTPTTPVTLPNTAVFHFTNSTDIVINNCLATGAELLGGYSLVGTTSEVTIENSVVLGNQSTTITGFFVDTSVNSVVLRGCVAQSCDNAGFTFQTTKGLQAIDCFAESCFADGFLIQNAAKVLCVECTASNNGSRGFNIIDSTKVLLERCCAFANTTRDININAGSSDVQVIETCANTISDLGTDTTIINLETVDAKVTTILDKINCEVGTLITQTDIPRTITAPGTYLLCEDVFSVGAFGINIASNNVTLDLNGFNIDGVSGVGTNGIVVNGNNNIQIKNGSLTNFATADINITLGTNILIEDVAIATNGGTGVIVGLSSDVTIRNCYLKGAGVMPCISIINFCTNIFVDGCVGVSDFAVPAIFSSTQNSEYTTYKNCTARANISSAITGFASSNLNFLTIESCITQQLQTGYSINSVNGFTLINNRAESVPAGGSGGFSVFGGSNNGVIKQCIVQASVTPGFSLVNVNDISLIDCQAINTGGGFTFTTIQNLIVDNCESNLSSAAGFICTATQQVYLGNCTVNKAFQSAYEFDSAIRSTMENCTAHSAGTGISLNASTSTVIRDCTLVQSLGTGVALLNGSSQNTVQGCVVDGASVNGYTIDSSSNLVVTECQALNVGRGFAINTANNIVLRNCIVDTTTLSDGFASTTANNMTFDGCTANNCSNNGFSVVSGTNSVYRTCIANNNTTGFNLTATTDLLFCQCIASANTTGFSIAASCINTKIIETCIGNNTTDVVNAGTNTEFVNIETVVSLIEALTSDVEVLNTTCCPVMITNAMLPFTTPAPGLYCVCETLSYAAGAAITIAVNNVTLDLKQNLLQRTTANTTGSPQAIVCTGSQCIIENGLIDSDGIAVTGANVTVRGITLTTTIPPTTTSLSIINFQAGSSAGIVEDCTIQGPLVASVVNGIEIAAANSSVLNCEVSGGEQGFIIDPTGGTTVIRNCKALSCFSNGFSVAASEVVIQECLTINNIGNGFSITGNNAQLYDSIAVGSLQTGFVLNGNNISAIRCSARLNQNTGFAIINNNIFVSGCDAEANVGSGFLVNGNGTSLINNSATTNTQFGFIIQGIAATANFGPLPSCDPFGAASFGTWRTTNSQNTVLANNTALRNGNTGIAMTGPITDALGLCPSPITYIHCIFPPLGIINNTNGRINPDPFPQNGVFYGVPTGGGATTSPIGTLGGLQAATNGNLMDPPG